MGPQCLESLETCGPCGCGQVWRRARGLLQPVATGTLHYDSVLSGSGCATAPCRSLSGLWSWPTHPRLGLPLLPSLTPRPNTTCEPRAGFPFFVAYCSLFGSLLFSHPCCLCRHVLSDLASAVLCSSGHLSKRTFFGLLQCSHRQPSWGFRPGGFVAFEGSTFCFYLA